MLPIVRRVLRAGKIGLLKIARGCGAFGLAAGSEWRRNRLLILCYHGLSLNDEHLWQPAFYLTPSHFRARMEALKRLKANVLAIDEAIERLYRGDLPPRSVLITFDDGFHDFYRHGFPVLKELGLPATVYCCTYYARYKLPVFNVIVSYLLWRGRGRVLPGRKLGVDGPLDLRTGTAISAATGAIMEAAISRRLSTLEKDGMARALAGAVNVDYDAILEQRMLQIMTSSELNEIASAGISVQMHTHRHRTPRERELFRRELEDNRTHIVEFTRNVPSHFCYPSGVYDAGMVKWLEEERVLSATTCDLGLASQRSNRLLLPRLLDSSNVHYMDFEAWFCGLGALLPRWRT